VLLSRQSGSEAPYGLDNEPFTSFMEENNAAERQELPHDGEEEMAENEPEIKGGIDDLAKLEHCRQVEAPLVLESLCLGM